MSILRAKDNPDESGLGFFARVVSHKRLCHLSHLFNR